MTATQERTSVLVVSHTERAPEGAVLRALDQNAAYVLTAERLALITGDSVRAVVNTLNDLLTAGRVTRIVPCTDGGDLNSYTGLAAVWSVG